MIKIKIKNKSFANKILFTNVSLELNSGLYVLKGDNGVGKSTLLNMLYKEDNEYDGFIYIDNKNIKDIDKSSYRNNICTYITQDNKLFKNLTVKENLDLLTNGYEKMELEKLLKVLNFAEVYKKDSKFKNLSGGEKQKLKIIIGLLQNTEILLIDEIENNLDKQSIKNINDYLINENKLIIMSSHSLTSKSDLSQIIIENKQVRLNSINKEQVALGNSNNKDRELSKKGLRKVSKTTRTSKFILTVVITIFMGTFLLLGFNINQILEYGEIFSDGRYGETSSMIYAPMFNSKLDPVGDKSWLEEIPAYFTNEDKEKLEDKEYVTEIIPVAEDDVTVGATFREDKKVVGPNLEVNEFNYYDKYGLSNYDYRNFEDSLQIQAGYLLNSKRVNDNVPNIRVSNGNVDNILYGEVPEDNSNEIMIDINYAMYLAQKQNLESIGELVGTTVNLNLKTLEDIDTVDLRTDYDLIEGKIETESHIISGIYTSYPESTPKDLKLEYPETTSASVIIYPYDENLDVIQMNNYGIPHTSETDGIPYEQEAYDPVQWKNENFGNEFMSLDEFKDMYPDNLYYKGFYVEVENEEDLEKLTNDLFTYNPYIEVKNNYMIEKGHNYSIIIKKITRSIAILLGIMLVYLISIIFLLKYYKIGLKENTEILQFYGYDGNNIKKYINIERKQLAIIISILAIMFSIIALQETIFLTLFFVIVGLLTILLVIFQIRDKQ